MVVILQQILPKYRFDVLKYLEKKQFSILYSDVIKENSLHSYKSDADNFIEIPIFRIGEKYIQRVWPFLYKRRPDKVVCTPELRNFTFWVLLVLRFFLRFKLIVWTHGVNNRDFFSGKISVQSWFRLLMMKLSDGVIVYSKDRAEKLGKMISNPIYIASNTLDTPELDKVYNQLKIEGVGQIKTELGIKLEFNFIFVGRLIRNKQIEKSIDLFKKIKESVENCAFHIIGDGPESEHLKEYVSENQVSNVYFHGAINDPELLGKWIYIADLHFHLGYVGLAVVHSLCYGTPIVTLKPDPVDGPFHSPEFGYLNKLNAVVDNEDGIFIKVSDLMSNNSELNRLKKAARETYVSECSINNFLSTFEIIGAIKE